MFTQIGKLVQVLHASYSLIFAVCSFTTLNLNSAEKYFCVTHLTDF